jgi:hypothetical protein
MWHSVAQLVDEVVEPLGVLGQGFDPARRVQKVSPYERVKNGRIRAPAKITRVNNVGFLP